MKFETGKLTLRLARDEADLLAAQRLRYQVFVEEMSGDGRLVDHEGRFERDEFDTFCDHLVLIDETVSDSNLSHVVGAYRLLTSDKAAEIGRFYSEGEYDLAPLKTSGRRILELGRSCVAKDHRRGPALQLLWSGLANYVLDKQIEVLFGVASLHGTDIGKLALPLSHLFHTFLAPQELRVRAVDGAYQSMELVPPERIDRVAAMRDVPPLIKSYLRLGGFVGDGAFVDHAFNTTDVCLVMDTSRLNAGALRRYVAERAE